MTRLMGYRDALLLLGGRSTKVTALDRAAKSALALSTGGVSDPVLSLFGPDTGLISHSAELLDTLKDRLGGDKKHSRAQQTRRLEAAHAIIVVTAFFDALSESNMPLSLSDIDMGAVEQAQIVAESAVHTQDFMIVLLDNPPPRPTPDLPFDACISKLATWYRSLSIRLLRHLHGLVVWDSLTAAEQGAVTTTASQDVIEPALQNYQRMFAQLAVDSPEMQLWTTQTEHQATRHEVRKALTTVTRLLADLPAAIPSDTASALARRYDAEIRRPIFTDADSPEGLNLPKLDDIYLDPKFRVQAVLGQASPASEEWWESAPIRSDLSRYLAGALLTPEATITPLVLLGQPGAGKSTLTKVLAARLPPELFVAVRVELRDVPAELDLQAQIEAAIRANTGYDVNWPTFRATLGCAMPVVILDGYDELLQATGVSQSDYLELVEKFQQRELDLDRPLAVIVTTRTAVADRARYPRGVVALKLENFSEPQVAEWLDTWNRCNADYFARRNLHPLESKTVLTNPDLATQPLLLLMLAMYDADNNALRSQGQADADEFDEARLYEALLTSFARREVRKPMTELRVHERKSIEHELYVLALVALAMSNRRRQWVTSEELKDDLDALVIRPMDAAGNFRRPLDTTQLTLGRFFFIQNTKVTQGSEKIQVIQFLHATFGEYLVARLAARLSAQLLAQHAAALVQPTLPDDDLLFQFYSFSPLSSRQTLRFLEARMHEEMGEHLNSMGGLLLRLRELSSLRHYNSLSGKYQPAPTPVPSRYALYSANLVLMALLTKQEINVRELFPNSADAPEDWHRLVLLWRSALRENDWADLAQELSVTRTRSSPTEVRELTVRLASRAPYVDDELDPFWLYSVRPNAESDTWWQRTYWREMAHKMSVSGGTNDAVALHALEPVFRSAGPGILTFVEVRKGKAYSVANRLLELLLTSATSSELQGIESVYRDCVILATRLREGQPEAHKVSSSIILQVLGHDIDWLPIPLSTACVIACVPSLAEASALDEHLEKFRASTDSEDDMRLRIDVLREELLRAGKQRRPSPRQLPPR